MAMLRQDGAGPPRRPRESSMNSRLWIAGATLALVGCGSTASPAARAPYSASGPSRTATPGRPMAVAPAPRRAQAAPSAAMPSIGTFAGATSPSKFRQDIALARSNYMRMTETERPAARREMGSATGRASLPDAELADVVAELGEDAEKDLASPAAPAVASTPAAPAEI